MSTSWSSFSTKSSTGSNWSSAASQMDEGKKLQATLQGPFLRWRQGPAHSLASLWSLLAPSFQLFLLRQYLHSLFSVVQGVWPVLSPLPPSLGKVESAEICLCCFGPAVCIPLVYALVFVLFSNRDDGIWILVSGRSYQHQSHKLRHMTVWCYL